MARRLVHVDVDAHHQVERPRAPGAGGPAFGRAHDRVAGEREQRPHLALAGRVDLLRQAGDRQLAERLRQAAHAAAASAPTCMPLPRPGVPRVFAAPAAAFVNIAPPGRSRLPVSDVQHVDEPARERAELLRAGADPPVDRGALGAPPARAPCAGSRRRAMPHASDAASGAKSRGQLPATSSSPCTCSASAPEVDQALLEQHVQRCRTAGGRRSRAG